MHNYSNDIIEDFPGIIIEFDNFGKITNLNNNFEKILGFSKKECFSCYLDEMYRNILIADINDIGFTTVKDKIIRVYAKNGEKLYLVLNRVIKEKNGMMIGGFDILFNVSGIIKYQKEFEFATLHDPLTALYNYVFFVEELKRYSKSREYPISILVYDIDGLQIINNKFGRDEGDKLILELSNIISTSVRTSDIVARISGNEFGVILLRAQPESIEKILWRIEEKIADFNFKNAREDYVLSASYGYSFAIEPSNLLDNLKMAEEELNRQKLLKKESIKSQTLKVLLSALAEKDNVTSGHTERVSDLCSKIGKAINLPQEKINKLLLLAVVHDIGKIGIPDKILKKADKLTDEEMEIMKKHTEIGYRIAMSSPDLTPIADLVLKHHERWDGRGYPFGLKSKDIPIECRILAIVDSFDAMVYQRPYNTPKSILQALDELVYLKGTVYDPELVDIFVKIVKEELEN